MGVLIATAMFGRWCIAIFAILGSVSALSCPPANFTTPFEINANFNLTAFISARWYVQQQMECGLEPANLFQCQYAEYKQLTKKTFWGFSIQGHDHIDMIPPNRTSMDLHPCVDVVDEARGKLQVGQCFLPKLASGPYWVYQYDETQGFAAVGGGLPKEEFPGGCRTGTGHVNSGLWIFTRLQQRNDTLVDSVRGLLGDMGFDLAALKDVPQTGCPKWQTIERPITYDSTFMLCSWC